MADDVNKELVRKLQDSREYINQLLNMEKKEKWNVEQKIMLATEAMRGINDALYKMTGDEFYQNT